MSTDTNSERANIVSEHSERSEHTVVLLLTFLSIYNIV